MLARPHEQQAFSAEGIAEQQLSLSKHFTNQIIQIHNIGHQVLLCDSEILNTDMHPLFKGFF